MFTYLVITLYNIDKKNTPAFHFVFRNMLTFIWKYIEAIEWRKTKQSQTYKGLGDDDAKDVGACKDIGRALKVIFCNPVFDLITLAGVIEIGIVTAFAAFLPKIIQFQFGQTTAMAAIVAGM